jgi:hypothetical protein
MLYIYIYIYIYIFIYLFIFSTHVADHHAGEEDDGEVVGEAAHAVVVSGALPLLIEWLSPQKKAHCTFR